MHLHTLSTIIQALQSNDGIGSSEDAVRVIREIVWPKAPTLAEIFSEVEDEE